LSAVFLGKGNNEKSSLVGVEQVENFDEEKEKKGRSRILRNVFMSQQERRKEPASTPLPNTGRDARGEKKKML